MAFPHEQTEPDIPEPDKCEKCGGLLDAEGEPAIPSALMVLVWLEEKHARITFLEAGGVHIEIALENGGVVGDVGASLFDVALNLKENIE